MYDFIINFIANATNLINAIKELLHSSRLAHGLPNNYIQLPVVETTPSHVSSIVCGPYEYDQLLPKFTPPATLTPKGKT